MFVQYISCRDIESQSSIMLAETVWGVSMLNKILTRVSWSMPGEQPGQLSDLSIQLCSSVLGQYFLYLDPSSQLQSVKVILTKIITLLHINK